MIQAFELTWSGISHADGNRTRLSVMARAFPGQPIAMHAEASHLREVFTPESDALRQVTRHAVRLPDRFRNRPHIASWRRLWREWGLLWRALRRGPAEPTLVVLLSSTCTGILAAQLAVRWLLPRGSGLQVILHGELNAITGWRPRNPFTRMLDFRAALSRRIGVPTRYVVLEPTIRAALLREMPGMEDVVDVWPHTASVVSTRDVADEAPVRVGLVGQATRDKGIDLFLEMAARAKAAHGTAIEFHHIGRVPKGTDLAPFRVLDSVPATEGLPGPEYDAYVARMHFVFLPLRPEYYRLSASGALLDAVARLKPVIIADLPLSRYYFETYGDIGYIYRSPDEIPELIERAARSLSDGSYRAMQANLRKAAESRSIPASAEVYRTLVAAMGVRDLGPHAAA